MTLLLLSNKSFQVWLATLQGDYEIQVKPDAQPFSLGTARNIPLPLCDKVKQELDVIKGTTAYSLVLWHGGCEEEEWRSENWRLSEATYSDTYLENTTLCRKLMTSLDR